MRMLGFDGVTKRFGPVRALDGCTFAARPGPDWSGLAPATVIKAGDPGEAAGRP